jgi:hypothetical protein
VFIVLVVFAMLVPGLLSASADEPANDSFERTWARTDRPVAEGMVNRTWMWGPDAFTGELLEPYFSSLGGQRAVQYFDKARMEINHPNTDPDAPWYVTNGLLVVELMTGMMQVGEAEFEDLGPAWVNVAGDPDDPGGPTYATFGTVMDGPPLLLDIAVTWRIDRDGNVSDDPALASYGVTASHWDELTKHTVASPFWAFMNSYGLVYEDGVYKEDALFPNPYYATGRPVSEAYWADVLVGGEEKLVLVQCFERRCLTYTPSNEPGWQVEAGNVGRHYYQWRYEQPNPLAGGILATFDVVGDTYKIWITNPATIDQVIALAEGESEANIPNGRIEYGPGQGDHNAPYSWHIDPEEVEMAEFTIELCDAEPSFVEENVEYFVDTVGWYCPWGAELVGYEDYR